MPHRSASSPTALRSMAAVIGLAALLALGACATVSDATDPGPTEDETPTPAATTPMPTGDGGDDGNGNGDPGEVTVTLQGFAFRAPEGGSSLTIPAGTAVNFVNADTAPHTATHGQDGNAADGAAFDIDLPAGASGSFTFDEPGTYSVTCRIHPAMNMTVTVQ